MADTVTILGMTFEQGEVLTSAKMNLLASKVDTIIRGINEEASRAKAAEDAIDSRIAKMQAAINQAIAAERERAVNAEEALAQTFGTSVSFFRGSTNTSLSELRGNDNNGMWYVSSRVIGSSYVLVLSDSSGNTYQYQFNGNVTLQAINTGNSGCAINTRYFRASDGQWSEWLAITGEKIDSLQKSFSKQEFEIKGFKQTVDKVVLNKEIKDDVEPKDETDIDEDTETDERPGTPPILN